MSEWIKCSDRLPSEWFDVLLTVEFMPGDWRTKAGGLDSDGKWWLPGASWTPTHWQPLPEPPK